MCRHTLGPWLLCTAGLVLGCSDDKESAPTAPTSTLEPTAVAVSLTPGDPLAWVTASERVRFEQGAEQFDVEFEEETGLGPLFNEASCAECHEDLCGAVVETSSSFMPPRSTPTTAATS
jgi:CxxC motif-containing protein (DUF1111 family)